MVHLESKIVSKKICTTLLAHEHAKNSPNIDQQNFRFVVFGFLAQTHVFNQRQRPLQCKAHANQHAFARRKPWATTDFFLGRLMLFFLLVSALEVWMSMMP